MINVTPQYFSLKTIAKWIAFTFVCINPLAALANCPAPADLYNWYMSSLQPNADVDAAREAKATYLSIEFDACNAALTPQQNKAIEAAIAKHSRTIEDQEAKERKAAFGGVNPTEHAPLSHVANPELQNFRNRVYNPWGYYVAPYGVGIRCRDGSYTTERNPTLACTSNGGIAH